MDTQAFLNNSLHLHSETRVSMESFLSEVASEDYTVSQEGLLSAIQDFLKGSKKGAEGRLDKNYDAGKINKLHALIKNTYANPTWLDKQRFVDKPIKAEGITNMLQPEGTKPEALDLNAWLANNLAYMQKNHADWLKSVQAYAKHMQLAIKQLHKSGEYNTEDYNAFLQAVKGAGSVEHYAISPPKQFEPSQRKFQYDDNGTIYVLKVKPVTGEIKPLDKAGVQGAVAGLLKILDADTVGMNALVKAGNELYDSVITDRLIRVIKEGDQRWTKFHHWFSVGDIVLSFQGHLQVNVMDDQALFSVARYIDRSVK